MQIKIVQAGNRIREAIPRNDAGVVVYALSPGERSLNLETEVELLQDTDLESIIGGTTGPVEITDRVGSLIKPQGRISRRGSASGVGNTYVSIDIGLGPEVASGSQRWQDHIGIIHAERLMNPVRANVADRCCQVVKKLPLDVEIPLHHVIALRIQFYRP